MQNIYRNIKKYFLYYIIYLLFIIEIVINLKSKNLVPDESFTYNMIHHSFISIIGLTAQDVHPFLYYFICKIFTYPFQNMYLQIRILRIVSALPYLILLIIGNIYIKNKFSKSISITFMFCIITMPLLVDNIYTIRMYGWATLFTTIVYLLFRFACTYNSINSFILISLFSILSSYTHYYALLTVFVLYVLFFMLFIIKKFKLKYMILSIFIDILLYLPWLKFLLMQTKNVSKTFWSSKLTLENVIHIIIRPLSPAYKLIILYILPVLLLSFILIDVLLTIFNKKIKLDEINIIGIVTPFLVILLGVIFSIFINHSVILSRYITPSMGIFWLELSIFIIYNKYHLLRNIIVILILIIGSLSYIKNNEKNIYISNQFDKVLITYNQISKNSAIIYDNNGSMFGISDYFHNNYTLDYHNDIYKKTLKNTKSKNNIKLSTKYKHIYYFKTSNSNKLIKKFNKKYNMKRIYLSVYPQIKLYKIR